MIAAATGAAALEPVTLALNWKAQPELGGFYQAITGGHYAERGLDVSLRLGGPLVNNRPLLPVGRVDFLVGTNLLQAFDAVKRGIPTRVVAAMLQRDPQCLLAHASAGYETLSDLREAPLLLGAPGRHSFFLWLEARHGFRRSLLRPYNHSLAPFLARERWAVQGYATAEPRRVTDAGAPEPRVFLLADHGWLSYSTTIETRQQLIDERPDVVRAFVDASILGWVEYLYGDPSEANERILRDNRDLTSDQIAFSIDAMRRWGLVDSGDAERVGLGAIDSGRVDRFYRSMVDANLFTADEIDPTDAVDASFVGHGVGLDRKAALLATAD
ncbi:MAG: ABC transporter substrate-binding protein [Planctomycetota bacterium]